MKKQVKKSAVKTKESKPSKEKYLLDLSFNRKLDTEIYRLMKNKHRFEEKHRAGVKRHYTYIFEVICKDDGDRKALKENPVKFCKEAFIRLLEDNGLNYNGNWELNSAVKA